VHKYVKQTENFILCSIFTIYVHNIHILYTDILQLTLNIQTFLYFPPNIGQKASIKIAPSLCIPGIQIFTQYAFIYESILTLQKIFKL